MNQPRARARVTMTPTRSLDLRGRSCPVPLIELIRVVRELAAGDSVEVSADDRAFPANVTAWCAKTGHELVSLETRGGAHVALVRKSPTGTT